MSEKIRLDCKIDFQNTFCTKCINIIIDSIGPSIILRSVNNQDNIQQTRCRTIKIHCTFLYVVHRLNVIIISESILFELMCFVLPKCIMVLIANIVTELFMSYDFSRLSFTQI